MFIFCFKNTFLKLFLERSCINFLLKQIVMDGGLDNGSQFLFFFFSTKDQNPQVGLSRL